MQRLSQEIINNDSLLSRIESLPEFEKVMATIARAYVIAYIESHPEGEFDEDDEDED